MLRSSLVEELRGCTKAVYLVSTYNVLKLIFEPRLLLALATLQLTLATAHIIVFIIFLKEGFVDHGNAPQGSTNYFANTSTAIYAAQLFFYMTNVRRISYTLP